MAHLHALDNLFILCHTFRLHCCSGESMKTLCSRIYLSHFFIQIHYEFAICQLFTRLKVECVLF